MRIRKLLSLFMVAIMVLTTMGGSFATYYDEYPNAGNVSVTGIYYDQEQYYNGNGYGNGKGQGNAYAYGRKGNHKNVIRFTVAWDSVYQYSFDNENWHGNCNQRSKTFYIREDYYDQADMPGVEVVLPKSVNVLFLYVKDYSNQVKVFQYKFSKRDLEYIYGNNNVPQHIINVTEAIENLPSKENLRLDDAPMVVSARTAYNALSDGKDKNNVYNVHKLYALEQRLEELAAKDIKWKSIYPDLDDSEAAAGKLTEQYYNVPNQQYADLYKAGDKARIFSSKLGDPRYNSATIREHILKDTTPSSENVFYIYNFNNPLTSYIQSQAMAKKVWGFFYPPSNGNYKFKITSDDGHSWKMFLDDGKKLQDNSVNIHDASTTVSTKFDLHDISTYETVEQYSLRAYTPYPIFIEYFNHGGNAALKLQYKKINANGTETGWVDMKGNMFKPSTAYEFGFKAGNANELKIVIAQAEAKVAEFSVAGKIGNNAGQVSQADLDTLKQQLNLAKVELEKAIKNALTQVEIDVATQKLVAALEAFNNAVVKKPNNVAAPFVSQQGNEVIVAFDKDLAIDTYEIIISKDNSITTDDTIYKVTNGKYVLGGQSSVAVIENNLNGKLYMENISAPSGRYEFKIPLGNLIDNQTVNVFIRAAKGENKGDVSAQTITLLKPVKNFAYAVTKNQVAFYPGEVVTDTGFAFSYYPIGSTVLKEVYLAAKDKAYLMVMDADLDKINLAEAYRIKLNGTMPNPVEGKSVAVTNPTKKDNTSVQNLKVTEMNGVYKLTWDKLANAVGYEIFEGATDDVSKMTKWSNSTVENNVVLNNLDDGKRHYYAIRAKINDEVFPNSSYSNVVQVFKPEAPMLYLKNDVDRVITAPETTNYVIKGDRTTTGYYLITMPKSLLKLTTALNVVEHQSGEFVVTFTEANNAKMTFKTISPIKEELLKSTENPELAVYKVPYDREDVGFTIQALKNSLSQQALSQLSITKYVQGMSFGGKWAVGTSFEIGDRVNYDGLTYECLQKHIVHADNWNPTLTPALWKLIDTASPSDTLVQGISSPVTVGIKVQQLPPVNETIDLEKNPFAELVDKDSKNYILSTLGSEFEVTYRFTLNADEMYTPNFIFDLVENDYFTYDYPTLKASLVTGGTSTPLLFHTTVAKDSQSKTTKAVLYADQAVNYGHMTVVVTLKVKPVLKDKTGIMTLARNVELKKGEQWEDWKLAYYIDKINNNGVSVMNGLALNAHVEFNTSNNKPGSEKDVKTKVESLIFEFKPMKEIKTSH